MSLLHTCLAGLLLFLPTLPAAQNLSAGEAEPSPGFRIPAADLAAIVELPRSPQVEISPDGRLLLELTRAGAEALEDLARPERPLAGMRLDARRPGPSRVSGYPGFRLLHADTGEALPAPELPEGARIGHVSWSPDGRFLALALVDAEHWRLAVIELDGERARYSALPAMPDLNAVFGNPLAWLPEGRGLVFRAVPDQGVLPETRAGLAPRILQTDGRKAPGRTWADLLRTDEDEREFGHLATSRLWVVEHEGRDWQARALAAPPALYTSQQPSPDGRWLLVEELRPPFSRTRPWYDFPTRISVLHADGRPATVLADRPLADQVPISHGSCVTGARDAEWRPDEDATLAWIEALDGGDADRPAELRDELKCWPAPFDGAPVVLHRTADRLSGVLWHGPDLALVYSRWWPERRLRVERIRPGQPGHPARMLQERNWQDRYGDPGQPLMEQDPRGGRLLLRSPDGDSLYYRGRGATPQGERPFLDVVGLEGGSRRIYRCPEGVYESLLDYRPGEGRLLVSRESRHRPADLFRIDVDGGRELRLTSRVHPHPWLDQARREVIHYTRADGVALHGTLWLPPGWTPGQGPLPTLLWAYPDEFRSADTAGQLDGSPDRFERLSWANPVIWLQRGMAVLDDPSMPIVGEGETLPNDRFVEQLSASARAAIDELVRRGVCDPSRVAVGGHSYGAFMTANLLAHTDLFAAGFAFSGAYNRTLTPFGFQSEDRSFWQAPEVYMAMSPLAHADGITEPLLVVHGELDPNPGTNPLQSERLFEALKGLGGHARLCMLPWEGHGYRARENQLHLLWEIDNWLGQHLHTGPAADAATPSP